ncbi:MAG: hypothetical protein KGL39_03100 [Patescibacteria group bacterium]|nr:hypothetical protein [Patescibacteria group bacterium]
MKPEGFKMPREAVIEAARVPANYGEHIPDSKLSYMTLESMKQAYAEIEKARSETPRVRVVACGAAVNKKVEESFAKNANAMNVLLAGVLCFEDDALPSNVAEFRARDGAVLKRFQITDL